MQKKQRVRNEILDAARTLVARDGFDRTPMRAIAAGANVSHQTLYNYFPTKARLAAALLTRDTDALTARLDALLARDDLELTERFRAAVAILFEVIDDDARALWREVAALSFREPGEFMSLYDDYYAHARQRMRRSLQDARTRGDLCQTVDVELLVQTVWSIADHGKLVFILRDGLDREEIMRLLSRQIELVLEPYLVRP